MTELPVPADLRKALDASAVAKAKWDDITPISRRDFLTWISQAKQPETRKRRIEVTCSKLKSGMRRPCCFAVVPMHLYRALGTAPKAKAKWSLLTADEKRDFSDWTDEPKESEKRKERVEKACVMIAAGKKHP